MTREELILFISNSIATARSGTKTQVRNNLFWLYAHELHDIAHTTTDKVNLINQLGLSDTPSYITMLDITYKMRLEFDAMSWDEKLPRITLNRNHF